MNVIHTTRLLAAITVAAVLAPVAYAAADTQPVSRAEVKEQTRAANKAGALPVGEASAVDKTVLPAPTKTRAQRKAETLEANRNGALGDYGPNTYKAQNVAPREALAKSNKTLAEGKAETLQAAKDNKMMPPGEAIQPSTH
jgi:opacity protein-like surface antigen